MLTFKQLEKAAANDSNWYCLNYALGAEDSVASINVSKDTQFSSFHQASSTGTALFGGSLKFHRVEEVEIRQLDSVLDVLPTKLDNKTYLKLDTQGWDLEVLKGAHHALTYVAALQTEVAVQQIYDEMPPMQDSLSAIMRHGFTPSGFFPVTLDSKLALIEYDLVAVRSAAIGDLR